MKNTIVSSIAAVMAAPMVLALTAVAPPASAAEPDSSNHMAQAAQHKGGMASARKTAAATRDWAKVDANHDHLVSPEEMEAYLKANPGPLKGK
jgi:hypothetical protein